MNKACHGFMLLEAILAIVIVSIGLTFVAQALLTNFHTGMRFQETVRSLMVMENRLSVLYATNGSSDLLNNFAQPLKSPYEAFSLNAHATVINEGLKKIDLNLHWPQGKTQGELNLATVLYIPNENSNGE